MSGICYSSTTDEINAFINDAVEKLNQIDDSGILTWPMAISYNESYFGEKEGELKALMNETNHCRNGIIHYLEEITTDDIPLAVDKIKELSERVQWLAASMVQIGNIVNVPPERYNEANIEQAEGMKADWIRSKETLQIINDLLATFNFGVTASNEDDTVASGDEEDVTQYALTAEATQQHLEAIDQASSEETIEEQAEEQDKEAEEEVKQQILGQVDNAEGGLLDIIKSPPKVETDAVGEGLLDVLEATADSTD